MFICFWISTDKNYTAPNFSLVNEVDLTRILRSEIFLHTDGQLHATHVILGYKSISSSFQSPKNVIKAKDPRLKQINIAVPGFLTGPPLEGTHQAVLLVQPIAEEGATSSGSAQEEEMVKIIKVTDSEEEFEVFDQLDLTESPSTTSRFLPSAQISADQETADIPKTMVLQRRKDTSLLKHLESHARGSTPEVAIRPRPPNSSSYSHFSF